MRSAAARLAAAVGLLLTGVIACAMPRSPAVELAAPANASSYDWQLPPGFPQPSVPADNPMSAAKVELGRRLFYDSRMSETGRFACASCHRQELAFTDGRARAVGATGQFHPRSTMSLANVAYGASFAWADPTLHSLEEQARIPMFNRQPIELGVAGDGSELIARLATDREYPARFADAFPHEAPSQTLTIDNIVRSLAAFERTLISGRSPYDRLLYLDEREALSTEAWRGMRLFFSESLGCFKCHSDFNFSGPTRFVARPEADLAFHNTGLYNLGINGLYPVDNPGLFEHTHEPDDNGRFRAPTLRNIALTAPYMHDGSIATLSEVIDHYAAGGRTVISGPYAGIGSDNPHKSSLITGFSITAQQKRELIAFLDSLTDEAFITDPRFSNPFATDPR
ncbi:MAG: MbnH family di-heme enzyme [Acidobacteriota bacterium]